MGNSDKIGDIDSEMSDRARQGQREIEVQERKRQIRDLSPPRNKRIMYSSH